jgi:O-antigen/teichoic acid export membrane protein
MWEELKSLFKHSTIYSVSGVLGKGVGFLMIPFYTHFLTPADYGTLELLDLSVMLFGLVITMWMNASIIRYYYEYDDPKHRNEVVSTVLLMATLLGVVSASLGIVFGKQLSAFILKSPSFYKYFWLLSVTFFFSSLNGVSLAYMRARQRSLWVAGVDVVSLILSLGLNIYFIAILKTGVIGILYSSLATISLSATILTVAILREVKLGFDPAKLKALAIFGAPLVVTSFSAFALNFSDRFFLQRFTNVSTVGIYALGYKFGFMMSFLVVQPFDMIWSARMYQIAKKPNGAELFSRIFRYYCLALVGIALGLSLIIKEVIAVISAPAFHSAYRVVPVVALAYIFQGVYRYVISGMYIAKKTARVGGISLATVGVNFLLNYLLIPRYQGLGAAWATTLSFLFMAGLSYVASQHAHPIPYRLSSLFVPATLAALLYLGSTRVEISSLLLSAIAKAAFLLLFPVVLYLVGFLHRNEVDRAREAAYSLWTRFGWGTAAAPER